VTLGLLLLGGAVAHAGPSALVWIPSTDIQPAGTTTWGVDHYQELDGEGFTYALVLAGLAHDRLEVGLDYYLDQASPLSFHAKYLLTPETDRWPAVAVGLCGWGTAANATDYNLAYLLLSRSGAWGRVTAGYCHGREATLGTAPDMFLVGYDRTWGGNDEWWAGVDYQSGASAYGALSVGLSRALSEALWLNLGYSFANDAAQPDLLYCGFSLTAP
jgi:hypothetical protein